MNKREVYLIADGATTVAEEQAFAERIKPVVRECVKGHDEVKRLTVAVTGKRAIEVSFECRLHSQANNVYILLVRFLSARGYRVLAEKPRSPVDSGVMSQAAEGAVVMAMSPAATATETKPHVPPDTLPVTVVKIVTFTGTARQVGNVIKYLRTLGGVTIEDPPPD